MMKQKKNDMKKALLEWISDKEWPDIDSEMKEWKTRFTKEEQQEFEVSIRTEVDEARRRWIDGAKDGQVRNVSNS